MRRIALAFAGLVLVGCASAPADTESRADVAAVTKSWGSAFNDCNPEKLAALYHPDAVFWGTVAQTIISTPAGVRQYFDRACAATPRFKVAFGEQFIRVYGDTAVNSGTYTFSRTVDGQLRSGAARYSFTYRNVNGTWIIADHHSSLIPAAPPATTPASPPPSR
jgi:uncharacterized protein (TIGR02246 family)